ncbi:MAG TPA: hypothetical protein VGM10_15480 [Actinocrinis sp.]|jgi:ABC-type Fe3+ transport system permease subunit
MGNAERGGKYVAYMRRRRRYRREEERGRRPYWREDPRARRRFGIIGCLWLVFVVVVVVLLLGFIFGGWEQGTKINQPGSVFSGLVFPGSVQNLVSGRSSSASSR